MALYKASQSQVAAREYQQLINTDINSYAHNILVLYARHVCTVVEDRVEAAKPKPAQLVQWFV